MYIFIDESGNFAPLNQQKAKFSTILAWVVPNTSKKRIFRKYRKFKESVNPSLEELKGSKLSEKEFKEFFEIFINENTFVHITAINNGFLNNSDVANHRKAQAQLVRDSSIPCVHQSMKDSLHKLADDLEVMSYQEYVQTCAMVHCVDQVIRKAILFFPQRQYNELNHFSWRIDAKGQDETRYENALSRIILPLVQSMSLHKPYMFCEDFSYKDFERFNNPRGYVPDHLREHITAPLEEVETSDLKFILFEDFQLCNSINEVGVQIADNLASAFNRAMNGTLQEPGWIGLGPLTISSKTQSVSFIQFDGPNSNNHFSSHHIYVSNTLLKRSMSLIL